MAIDLHTLVRLSLLHFPLPLYFGHPSTVTTIHFAGCFICGFLRPLLPPPFPSALAAFFDIVSPSMLLSLATFPGEIGLLVSCFANIADVIYLPSDIHVRRPPLLRHSFPPDYFSLFPVLHRGSTRFSFLHRQAVKKTSFSGRALP